MIYVDLAVFIVAANILLLMLDGAPEEALAAVACGNTVVAMAAGSTRTNDAKFGKIAVCDIPSFPSR
jgi:hypothetical protein